MEINKENIESFFVELVDNDFRITPVIEDDLVRIEIRSNQVTPISGTFIKDFLKNALDYLNYPYDYQMDLSSDQELYCSELVVCLLKKMNITLSKQTQVFKYRIISPTDLIEELVEKKLVKNVLILE